MWSCFMKVLIVADGDTKYGASHALCQMAMNLQLKPDIEITVIVNQESEAADYLRKIGCEVICVSYEPFYVIWPKYLWKLPIKYIVYGIKYLSGRLFAISNLQTKIKLESFDLIHSNSSREDLSAAIAINYNIPLVWHIREFGDEDFKCFSLRKDYIQLMNSTANVFIAVSEAVKRHWIKKGLNGQKIVKVYDGVKSRKQSVVRKTDLKQKKNINLVMTGSLQSTKGQEQAIAMMVKLKDEKISYHLDIIGDGAQQYTKRLKQMISKFDVKDSVRLLGYRTDVYEILPSYDIGLMCSKSEGFGLVTAEYMMAGLAVLASDSGANKELIREGIDGYLYNYGNVEDMKQKLLKIIANNLGGDKTHKYAMNNFSSKLNAERIYNVYKTLLDNRNLNSDNKL